MIYRREIDGLRALAVIPVILFHAGFSVFSGGYVGVDIFFVISGYLITSIISEDLENSRFSIVNFYERRARRILPALYFVIAISIPFAWYLLLPSEIIDFTDSVAAVSVFSSNIMFWKTTGYFHPDAELKPLLHTWSLAVEEQYYVFFPLFLFSVWQYGRKVVVALLVPVAIISIFLAECLLADHQGAAYYLLPSRAWELLIGAFVAIFISVYKKPVFSRAVNEVFGLVGLFAILYSVFFYDKTTPFPGKYGLVPVLGAALIILFGTGETIVGKFLGNKFFVGIGLVSYSAYLWHQPIFSFARYMTNGHENIYFYFFLILVTFVFAYISWRFVETPFRRKEEYGRKRIFQFSILAMVVAIATGLAGRVSEGFVFKYAEQDRSLALLNKIEAGRYVEERFDSLLMRSFDGSNAKKIFLVGDSFAQDLLNAVVEVGGDKGLQISTYRISAACGNLFISREIFNDKIVDSHQLHCKGKGLYENELVRKKMLESDEIWFASSWEPWQAELIGVSALNVRNEIAKPFKVFGRKEFGKIDIRQLINTPPEIRLNITGIPTLKNSATNNLLVENLGENIFIDIQDMLCSGDDFCPIFTKSGDLISFDGGHLTRAGAIFLGEKLMDRNLFDKKAADD